MQRGKIAKRKRVKPGVVKESLIDIEKEKTVKVVKETRGRNQVVAEAEVK